MGRKKKNEKENNYRKAVELYESGKMSWNSACEKVGVNHYPYIKDSQSLTNNAIGVITSTVNLIFSKDNVEEMFKSFAIKRYGLKDSAQLVADFRIGDLTDDELLHELSRRGYRISEGKLVRTKMVQVFEDVEF